MRKVVERAGNFLRFMKKNSASNKKSLMAAGHQIRLVKHGAKAWCGEAESENY